MLLLLACDDKGVWSADSPPKDVSSTSKCTPSEGRASSRTHETSGETVRTDGEEGAGSAGMNQSDLFGYAEPRS